MTKQIITAETVRLAWKAGESVIVYAKGDIVTQQAQDDARHYGITLTTETPSPRPPLWRSPRRRLSRRSRRFWKKCPPVRNLYTFPRRR